MKKNKYLQEQSKEILRFGMVEGEEYKISEVYENIFGKQLPQGGSQRKKQIENIDAYLISEKDKKRGYIKIIKFLEIDELISKCKDKK